MTKIRCLNLRVGILNSKLLDCELKILFQKYKITFTFRGFKENFLSNLTASSLDPGNLKRRLTAKNVANLKSLDVAPAKTEFDKNLVFREIMLTGFYPNLK